MSDGYGCAYMIKEESFHFNLVSQHLHNDRFKFFLGVALNEMKEACEKGADVVGEAPKSKL